MKTLILSLLLVSNAVGANPTKTKLYEVKTELMIKGKVVSAPGFIVRKNKLAHVEVGSKASLSQLKVDLIASETHKSKANGPIHVKLKVDFKDKTHKIQAQALADIEPGKSKVIQLNSGSSGVSMRVTADRKSL